MKMKPGDFVPLLKNTYHGWNEHKAPRLGAALAYYTVFSIGPLLFIVLQIVGLVYSGPGAREKLITQISGLIGPVASKAVESMMGTPNHRGGNVLGALIGFITLFAGAAGVFGQLQDALNTIWEVAPKPGRGFVATLRDRFASFVMVAGTGFLLLVSLVVSTAVALLGKFMQGVLPIPAWSMEAFNFVVAFGIVTLLFAMIFKVLPDATIQWSDVWVGAAITALLFAAGKFGLGIYLGRSGVTSTYGAAGSLVLLLLWVYYAAQILFFGAEFTRVYSDRFGSQVQPSENAVAVTQDQKAKQGMPEPDSLQVAARGAAHTEPAGPGIRVDAQSHSAAASGYSEDGGTTRGAAAALPAPSGLAGVAAAVKGKLPGRARVYSSPPPAKRPPTLKTFTPVNNTLAVVTSREADGTPGMPRVVMRESHPEVASDPRQSAQLISRRRRTLIAGVVLGVTSALKRRRS